MVDFSKITLGSVSSAQEMELKFAKAALMEIPDQYKVIKEKNLLDPHYKAEVLSHVINDDKLSHSKKFIDALLKKPFESKEGSKSHKNKFKFWQGKDKKSHQ